MRKFLKSVFVLGLIIVAILVYSAFIEPNLLIVKNYSLISDKIQREPIRVVQFTDTHLGDFFSLKQLQRVVDKINEQDADLVFFTGDLIDDAEHYQEDLEEVAAILNQINAKYGKYAVYGNRDYGGGAERFYEDLMAQGGFSTLVNDQLQIEINGTMVHIMGADDALIGYYEIESTVVGIHESNLNLLMIHEPDLIEDFAKYPIDLALSGHSHGGQVYIPFYGPIFKTALAEIYVRGFYDPGTDFETILYVNTGLGNTKAPFRLFNIPYIAVFDLAKE